MHHIRKTALSLAFLLTLAACSKHEEVEFSGTLIDVRSCNSLEIAADNSPAYIVALESPSDAGGQYGSQKNVVALYEPSRHLRIDDRIHGTFYFDENYSKTSCDWHNTDYSIPEGVFVKVVVD